MNLARMIHAGNLPVLGKQLSVDVLLQFRNGLLFAMLGNLY